MGRTYSFDPFNDRPVIEGEIPSFNFNAFVDFGPNDTAYCGWVPNEDRTKEQKEAHKENVAEMPKFKIMGKSINADATKVCLWECSKAINGGKHFMVFAQSTGSCVGNALGQAVWYLSAAEVVRNRDPEKVLLPFYLLPYGRSRYYAGLTDRGDGSFGSAAAKAIREDGILPADLEGLPPYKTTGGITWGSKTELDWSQGQKIAKKWLDLSKVHLVKTTAQIKNANEMREAIKNYYPCTIASDWGGNMRIQAQGEPAVLLNKRTTTWMHQMSVMAWWDHPSHGEIFYILNSWGPNAHGTPPDDSPPGGFWVKAAEIDYICKQRDTFSYSSFSGFPAQVEPLNFSAF